MCWSIFLSPPVVLSFSSLLMLVLYCIVLYCIHTETMDRCGPMIDEGNYRGEKEEKWWPSTSTRPLAIGFLSHAIRPTAETAKQHTIIRGYRVKSN
jgi:hypothetical protein